jgi:type I restriction enzyme R subunit
MVSIPSEQGVERSYLSWLDELGWETHGQDGSRGASVLDAEYERRSNEVIYWDLLAEQLVTINDCLTEENVEKFISSLKRDLDVENLMDGNEAFHGLLNKGKTFSVKQNGSAS